MPKSVDNIISVEALPGGGFLVTRQNEQVIKRKSGVVRKFYNHTYKTKTDPRKIVKCELINTIREITDTDKLQAIKQFVDELSAKPLEDEEPVEESESENEETDD